MILTAEMAARMDADAPRLYRQMTRCEWTREPVEKSRSMRRPSEVGRDNGFARQLHFNIWWEPVP